MRTTGTKTALTTFEMRGGEMPNKNYRKGRAAEYRAKRELEKQGWTVHRSAGSHGVDLVCLGTKCDGLALYVSVKSGKRRPTKQDRTELKRAKPSWVFREIWYYAPRRPVEIMVVA